MSVTDTQKLLKDYVLSHGKVTEAQVAEAEAFAQREGVLFERALIEHDMLSSLDIGDILSDIFALPYKSLLLEPPPDHAKTLMSGRCALRWKVYPGGYDPERHLLTLAVHDPEQIPLMKAVQQFFMLPCALTFSIGTRTEIEMALEQYFKIGTVRKFEHGGGKVEEEDKGKKRKLMKLSGLGREGGGFSPAMVGAPPVQAGRPSQAAQGSSQAQAYQLYRQGGVAARPPSELEELRRSLISAVALFVSAHLSASPDQISEVRERVRYCQLVATRLNMSPAQIDRMVLAAWMSVFSERREILKQLVTPYNLEEVILPTTDKPCLESVVLNLVRTYQALKKGNPEVCKDVNLTRRNLKLNWSAPTEYAGMLEVFLQLLMDEEFLSKIDQRAGMILIVDPAEMSTSEMAPPLMNSGYDVHVMPSGEAAAEFLTRKKPDLILVEMDQPQSSSERFCNKAKHDADTEQIPLIAILSQGKEKRAADALRSGADDFMMRPIDLDLLFLKMEKLRVSTAGAEEKAGVSGSLLDMTFTDLIQIISAGGRSMEVVLSRDEEEGHVFVSGGEIIHSIVGEFQGEEAFYRMMMWHEGNFTTRQCAEFPPRTIYASTMSLLMEGARLADEGALTAE